MINSSIYLIEDDFAFRNSTKALLLNNVQNHLKYLQLNIVEVNNLVNFYKNIENMVIRDFDIFIIDIQLQSYMDGLDFGNLIRTNNKACKIIYLTSLENKAIQIINKGIFPEAYLVKEADHEIMSFKLMEVFSNIEAEFIRDAEISNKTIMLNDNDRTFLILLNQILYFSVIPGLRNGLLLKTINKELIVNGSLNKIKKELPDPPFILNLKSHIINSTNINMLSVNDGLLQFKNNDELYLSPKIITKIKNKTD
ncbi:MULTISPECIES: LytTR family DNA-binding domain-containing protein [unclassified Enterococcus]|uniref:LytR/AlgR family response regulator transcription factor n=1 Tax=unclassified Enterococcus TaxID=2608891 RepID=UPI0015530D13|nr:MULTISPECIES: LytTR family DNA-binding domain-containing protein [unclassified Enterococcus]MBS7577452.1 response regulator transcription factor [Enterococcus sp. MMGLQ5-2]MBS7584858.1 response regulator transcription factor [Enterococcus sp. MMGLQ5-1]NPD12713.1 response regulator transcription factor [Enterococcus sp. MMGLQ5-1]NPD37284.1 response regulator transcription factor [Enterococcus sp. MMGLQ5-2]